MYTTTHRTAPICLSIYLSDLFIHLCIYVSIYPPTRTSTHPASHPPIHPSIHPSIHRSIHPSVHLSTCLYRSVYPSSLVCVFLFLRVYVIKRLCTHITHTTPTVSDSWKTSRTWRCVSKKLSNFCTSENNTSKPCLSGLLRRHPACWPLSLLLSGHCRQRHNTTTTSASAAP